MAGFTTLEEAREACASLGIPEVRASLATDEEGSIVERVFTLCKEDWNLFDEIVREWVDSDNAAGITMVGLLVVYQSFFRAKEMIEPLETKSLLRERLISLLDSPHSKIRQITVVMFTTMHALGMLDDLGEIRIQLQSRVSSEKVPGVIEEMRQLLSVLPQAPPMSL